MGMSWYEFPGISTQGSVSKTSEPILGEEVPHPQAVFLFEEPLLSPVSSMQKTCQEEVRW